MTAEEKIISAIEEATGISVTEEKIDAVKSRINMIFDYLGYEEGSSLTSDDGEKPAPGANGIDDALIKYLEELSRLTLTEDEEKKAKEDLTKILDYIDTLNQLDTDNVEPMSHPFPYTNNFRPDEVKPSEDRELILKNAPQQKDGCFKVPTTVE